MSSVGHLVRKVERKFDQLNREFGRCGLKLRVEELNQIGGDFPAIRLRAAIAGTR